MTKLYLGLSCYIDMAKFTALCCCLMLCLGYLEAARMSRYVVQWRQFDCFNHWGIVKNVSCRVDSTNEQWLSADFELSSTVEAVRLKYKLVVPRMLATKTDMVLFESELDGCKLLRDGVAQNRLVGIVLKNMLKDSNLARRCPGQLYFHNVSCLDGFPAFLPETEFTAYLNFYAANGNDNVQTILRGNIMEYHRARLKQHFF
ncbi:uncharacterized protein LOC108597656 isoform X2 [Drosophila busckii]|uniref:uncharacterized protein LOC108597656 isoform X2 n=1 Tax=Drosophila busckii TaxID=30019 RepID=UPI00083EB079|nr:uncharacterized protein LOC108597656 isoform X2 [Drosophila busckii]